MQCSSSWTSFILPSISVCANLLCASRLNNTNHYVDVVCDYWLRYRCVVLLDTSNVLTAFNSFDILGSFTFMSSGVLALYLGLSPGLTAIVLTQAQGVVSSIFYGMQFYVMVWHTPLFLLCY